MVIGAETRARTSVKTRLEKERSVELGVKILQLASSASTSCKICQSILQFW